MRRADECIVLYMPVLHRGYINLFERHYRRVAGIYLLGGTLIDELTFLEKEIRALDPDTARKAITSLGLFKDVRVIEDRDAIAELRGKRIVMPNEGISRRFVEQYLVGEHIVYTRLFLRWDESSVFSKKPIRYGRVSRSTFDRRMMARARREAQLTSDWWRQVGAVLVRDRRILIIAHNHHVPSEHTPYALGDPRDFIKAGERPEFSSALHAEKSIIITAARRGDTPLAGAHLYLTTFPCPPCAKDIAYSGITRLYFASGHASLDGQSVLEASGVELILVK